MRIRILISLLLSLLRFATFRASWTNRADSAGPVGMTERQSLSPPGEQMLKQPPDPAWVVKWTKWEAWNGGRTLGRGRESGLCTQSF